MVLTTPAQFLGMVASVYSGKPVYLNRPGLYNYDQKADIAAKFYWGSLSELQAKEFLEKSQIGFITLTSIENYPLEKISQYRFLKKIYENKSMIIFKVLPNKKQ